ncbi:hypothetical protein LCGC14_0714040 [marine sediment metagenome]|uniref:Uncharacterized protein n=1 Tax=marine sediment metagenome TaxID=412755 RepID=A0A0F9SZS5_9ZZZZ
MARQIFLETFEDLFTFIAEQGNIEITVSTENLNKVKTLINVADDIINSAFEWWYLQKQFRVNLEPPYETGTLTTTAEGTTFAGSGTAWSTNLLAKAKIQVVGDAEVYPVQSMDSDTALTLGVPGQTITYKGDAASGASYKIWTDVYALPSDFKEMLQPHQAFWPYYPQPLGIREFRRMQRDFATDEGRPEFYTLESDEDGTQSIIFIPFPDELSTVEGDYVQMTTPMSADGDKPLIPRDYRDAIAWKALQLHYQGERNDMERARYFEGLFGVRRARMLGDHKTRQQEDLPMIRPSFRRYERRSRRSSRVYDSNWSRRTLR